MYSDTIATLEALYGHETTDPLDLATLGERDGLISRREARTMVDALWTQEQEAASGWDWEGPHCPVCGNPSYGAGHFCSLECEQEYGECPKCGAPSRKNRVCPDCWEP